MNAPRHHILGWLVFIFSALGFTVSALRTGDGYALVGALLFLAGCLVFLIPLLLDMRRD